MTLDKTQRKQHQELPIEATTKSGCKNDENKPPFMFAGIIGSIFASVFFSLGILCVKLMPDDNSIGGKAKALLFRGSMIALFCGLSVLFEGSSVILKKDEILVTSLRALFGTVAMFGNYVALNYMPFGDVTALVFSSTIWTSLLGYFLLNEPFQWFLVIALPVSICGIILIAHPALIIADEYLPTTSTLINTTSLLNETSHELIVPMIDSTIESDADQKLRWIGIGISLLTSLGVSLVYIVLRCQKGGSIQVTTFWFGVAMATTGLVISCLEDFRNVLPATSAEWILLISNGFVSWLGQTLVQWALLYEGVSICSVIRTLDVALAFIFSAIFLKDDITWTSVSGAAIIVAVVIMIILNNWIVDRCCKHKEPIQDSDDFKIEVKEP